MLSQRKGASEEGCAEKPAPKDLGKKGAVPEEVDALKDFTKKIKGCVEKPVHEGLAGLERQHS